MCWCILHTGIYGNCTEKNGCLIARSFQNTKRGIKAHHSLGFLTFSWSFLGLWPLTLTRHVLAGGLWPQQRSVCGSGRYPAWDRCGVLRALRQLQPGVGRPETGWRHRRVFLRRTVSAELSFVEGNEKQFKIKKKGVSFSGADAVPQRPKRPGTHLTFFARY